MEVWRELEESGAAGAAPIGLAARLCFCFRDCRGDLESLEQERCAFVVDAVAEQCILDLLDSVADCGW